jgi:CHAD domain-containing protein
MTTLEKETNLDDTDVGHDKWLDGIDPRDSVENVAREALRVRLSRVLYFMPLAAKKSDEDPEYVHQLRVSTRRSASAMRLFRDFLPERTARRVKKALRRIRGAASEARDLDILGRRYENGSHSRNHVLTATAEVRRFAQRDIVRVDRALNRDGRLRRQVDRLIERTRPRGKTHGDGHASSFAEWARERLRRLVQRFFDAVPCHPTDLKELHRLRIRGKEMRYAVELLASVFAPELREDVYPELERLQEILGEVNDRAMALVRLSAWAEATTNQNRETQFRQAWASENESLTQSIEGFREWWTPARVRNLGESFERLLDTKE